MMIASSQDINWFLV